MNIVSFYAPRQEHPFFQDYAPFLDILAASCERYGHRHVCLTDNSAVRDAFMVALPRPLMPAYLKAQLAYLEAYPDTPSLMTGADCVLAVDPACFAGIADDNGADIVITVDDRFTDCRVNMGAIYLPRPGALAPVWRDALARCGEDWGDDQRAFRDALASAEGVRVHELPCDGFNRAPDHPGDDCKAAVLHFRGPRKRWMAAYCAHHLGIGDGVVIKLEANTETEVAISHIMVNCGKRQEYLTLREPHEGVAVIVGSGPSAENELPTIRAMAEGGAAVFGLNGAVRWLEERGIVPRMGMLLDMRRGNWRFVDGTAPTDGWIMASHCHPSVIATANKATLYHHAFPAYHPHLPKGAMVVGGGPTIGISAMYLACVLGFRTMHLFGYDSSFQGEQTHLLAQPMTDQEAQRFEVHVGAQAFQTNAAMYAQASAFEEACRVLQEGMPDLAIAVHGDGLLPAIAHAMTSNAAMAA